MRTLPALLVTALLLLAPAAGQAQPVETELPGVTAEVVELRQAGGVLRLAVRFANSGEAKKDEFDRYTFDRIVLVDVKSKRKHFPLKDANGQYIGGPIGDWMSGGRIALKVPRQAVHRAVGVLRAGGAGYRDERRGAVRVPVRERAGDRGPGQGLRERHRRKHPRRGAGDPRLGETGRPGPERAPED